jgi:hypothetical protein
MKETKDYDGSDFEDDDTLINHNQLIENLHGFKGSFVGNMLICKSTLSGRVLDITQEEQYFLERMLVRCDTQSCSTGSNLIG